MQDSTGRIASNLVIMNTETAEIVRDIYEDEQLIFRRKSTHAENKDDYFYFSREKAWLKAWEIIIPSVMELKLTGAEFAVLLFLMAHTQYYSGVAAWDNGEHITTTDVMNGTGLSDVKTSDALKKLRDKGIIARCIVGTDERQFSFFLNPFLFVKGVKINETLAEMFKTTKWYRAEWLKADGQDFTIGSGNHFFRVWQHILPEIVSLRLAGSELMILLLLATNIRYESG